MVVSVGQPVEHHRGGQDHRGRIGLALPHDVGRGAVAGLEHRVLVADSADGAMPRPPINPAAKSDRMSPNMFSITITSKSQGFFTIMRGAGIDIKQVGFHAGEFRLAFGENFALPIEGLNTLALSTSVSRPGLPRFFAARQGAGKIEQPLVVLRVTTSVSRASSWVVTPLPMEANRPWVDSRITRNRCRARPRRRSGSARRE